MMEVEEIPKCECECHFGGAESCPGCKKNHNFEIKCEHCKE